MRILWIFLVLAIFSNIEASNRVNKMAPAEMIMMGGFGDDDVESTDDSSFETTPTPLPPRVLEQKNFDNRRRVLIPTNSIDHRYTKPSRRVIEKKPTEIIIDDTHPRVLSPKDQEIINSMDDYEFDKDVDEEEYKTIDLTPSADVHLKRGNIKIALLVPKDVIGSYANSVSNSIISYLLFQNSQFQFEVFDTGDEEEVSIAQKLSLLKSKGYQFVIAPVTAQGADVLARIASDLYVYVPTINKMDMPITGGNITFGGIDYQKQIDALLSFANEKVAIFNDGSRRAKDLSLYIKERSFENIVFSKEIQNIKTNLSSIIRHNKKLKDATIFLNMPIVKSSLLASQFSQYNIKPHAVLSTQANYNPLLFKLTQFKDREFFYIANSIFYPDNRLKDINLLLGNNPLFSWIDYSTSIGLDHIFSTQLESRKIFEEYIEENQVDYKVRIEKAGKSSFKPIGSAY